MSVSSSIPSRLRTTEARQLLQRFDFTNLFVEELNWNNPAQTRSVSIKDQHDTVWQVREIAQLSGFRVFEVTPADAATPLPDAETQAAIWKTLDAHSIEKLIIFIDRARTQSLWYWRKREGARFLPRRHPYLRGQPGDLFLSKLISANENSRLPRCQGHTIKAFMVVKDAGGGGFCASVFKLGHYPRFSITPIGPKAQGW